MRGLISEEKPGALGVASPLRQAIPAVYQEDPLFMQLCAAFDDLVAPLVTAVDCFDAYLDPYLAPADFLPWLADLVGYQGSVRRSSTTQGSDPEREQIASAMRDHTRRGTPLGVREAAARAAGVPVEQVRLEEPGGTTWSTAAGGAGRDWPQAAARLTVAAPGSQQETQKVREAVHAAIEAVAGVHCVITVDVVEAGDTTRPHRARPSGARTYGGES
jgi:phage tail-like protein